MSTKIACTLATLLLLTSVPTMAQENPKLHFLVNVGLPMPEAPDAFRDGWKDGSNFGGGIGYRFSPRLSVQGLVNYDRFAIDSEGLLDELGFESLPSLIDLRISGAETTVLSLSGELKASLTADLDRVSPYVTIGAGVAEVEVSDLTITTSILGFEFNDTLEGMSETSAMATVGGGVDIPIGERLGVFVEGRYQTNFTEDESMNFGSFRAGLRIKR